MVPDIIWTLSIYGFELNAVYMPTAITFLNNFKYRRQIILDYQKMMFNDLFNLSDDMISQSKIVLNMKTGGNNIECLDIWLNSDPINREVSFSYWSHFGNQRNFSLGNIVFGFVRMGNDRYLLVSVGQITDIPDVHDQPRHCGYIPLNKYNAFLGRLIVKVSKGNVYSRYVFNLKKYIQDIEVEQILRVPYGSQPFPGFEKLLCTYTYLKQQIDFEEWKGPLSSINGIYLLNDKLTGKKYVGSATGYYGIYGRFKTYLADGYDASELESGKPYPNNKLKKLVEEKKIDYIKNHFVFSILEVIPKQQSRDYAIERENHWKEVLNTRDDLFGYNSN